MFTETLPSGRVRAGFKLAGRKVQRTFDYGFEAEAWASETEARARAATLLGQSWSVNADGDLVIEGAPATSTTTPATSATSATSAISGVATTPAKPKGPTVATYGRTWINARRGKLTANTLAGYETHLRSIGRDPIAGIRLDALRLVDVDEWISRQAAAGDRPPTINARLKVLRMLLRYAVANRVPGVVDATEGVDMLKTDLREFRWLTWEEDAALLAAARTVEERAMILAALDAGLRWEEAYGLGVDCLDGLGHVVVRQVVERTNRTIRRSTKSGKGREVPLTDRLEAALVSLIDKARAEGRFLLVSAFVDGVERPVDYWNNRRDMWRPICHAAGVNRRTAEGFVRLRFHDLRHTFGTRLAQAGVPSREIMELMGHADEKTTQRYTHAGNATRRAALLRAALTVEATEGDPAATITPIRKPQETRKTA